MIFMSIEPAAVYTDSPQQHAVFQRSFSNQLSDWENYEMNFTLRVLLVYNDNGSVQTLCITRVSALCTKCLHRPIVIINQQYTKGEIHFIYLHYFHVYGFCFINRYYGNGCVSLENPTVCTINGRA